MALPWRTVYSPDGVDRAVFNTLWGSLIPLILISPALFGQPEGSGRATAAAVAAGLVLWRAQRLISTRIETHPDGVVIANVYRTYRLPWSRVKSVMMQGESLTDGDSGSLLMTADELGVPQHLLLQDGMDEAMLLRRIAINTGDKLIPVRCVSTETVAALTQAMHYSAETSRLSSRYDL